MKYISSQYATVALPTPTPTPMIDTVDAVVALGTFPRTGSVVADRLNVRSDAGTS